MSEHESKSPTYINYPYDRFLKVRIEFLILTQSDLKARIMRLIERCVESEREYYYRTECNKPCNKNKSVEVPDGFFATISHKFFMDEMWGTVQSETTLRDALKELEDDHLIIRRPGDGGPYDPPHYALNKPLIDHLFKLLPSDVKEINMISLMKQPRKKKNEDGTVETGAIIDPLARKIRDTITGPLDPQLLDPYASIIAPLSSTRGVQKLYPKRYKENFEEKREETTTVSDDTQQQFDSLSQEEIEMILAHRKQQTTQPSTPTEKPKRTRQSKTVKVEPPAQPELDHINEPDLSHLSELETTIYNDLLRNEDQPKYLAWPADMREVYNNLLGTMGYAVPISITPKVEESVKLLKKAHPTIQGFKDIAKRAHQQDQYYPNGKKKPAERQFYKGRNLKPWDYVREIASLQDQISITQDGQTKTTASSGALTHDEAVQLAADALVQTKKAGYTKIQATAYTKDNVWQVKVIWEDGTAFSVSSRQQWEKSFKDNYEMDIEDGKKGAR